MQDRPWGTRALRRLGESIRDGVSTDTPRYDEVMAWYNDLAIDIQTRLAGMDVTTILDAPLEISSRPKTIDTLREKLLRDRATPLPMVQDIAGVRVEAEMSLTQQDRLVHLISQTLAEFDPRIRDLRATPHSGYRAVHVWIRAYGGPAEIQVRTHWQGAWANVYEAAGDRFGRSIRYGALPDDPSAAEVVKVLQEISLDRIAPFEERRPEDLPPEVRAIEDSLRALFDDLLAALRSFQKPE